MISGVGMPINLQVNVASLSTKTSQSDNSFVNSGAVMDATGQKGEQHYSTNMNAAAGPVAVYVSYTWQRFMLCAFLVTSSSYYYDCKACVLTFPNAKTQ